MLIKRSSVGYGTFQRIHPITAGHDVKYQPIGTKLAGGCHNDAWGGCQELPGESSAHQTPV